MGGGGQKSANDNAADDGSVNSKDSTKKDVVKEQPIAGIRETLSFAFEGGAKSKLLFVFGCIGGVANGCVYPAVAWVFSSAFSELSANESNGLDPIKKIAFWMVGIGFFALVAATVQTGCFEVLAYHGAQSLRLKWFHALLRQDTAFFDVYDIGGLANSVNPAAAKYRRGMGRKFGEGIQFTTMAIGSVFYAFYEEWRVTLVVILCAPLIGVFSLGVIKISQSKSSRATEAYSRAGSVAYSTVSGIKTILSLNAGPKMIMKYGEATEDAFTAATKPLVKQGFVFGMMLGSFMIMYCVFTLFGTFQIYKDIRETGCDPLGVILDNEACPNTASSVFAVMLGIAFGAQGASQVANFIDLFAITRVAAGQAMMAINRKQGHPEEKIYHIEDEKDDTDDNESVSSNSRHSSHMIESPDGRIKAILPPYEIDAMSDEGLKPEKIDGRLTFENVGFNYPTRPGQTVLNELSIDIPAGNTIAFVGPSGGGKSTVVKLLERFYDPTAGSVKLDGTDIKEINVKHLRHTIGYVGQEPVLFATSIGKNIAFGCPGCSQEQIEEAAKQANAHDFIVKLPDGYDTDVGDKGSQLSGGQKQRIAIARVLIADPKILLLDEATSALDSQSELVVQKALEKIISIKKRTTVIIAHRLSTIRNADLIAVVMDGTIVETGTHDMLIKSESYYKKLVDSQGQTAMKKTSSVVPQPTAVGQSESQMDFEKVPDQIDMDGDPMIVFRNVSFAYPTRPTKTILDKFKLKVYKGETIGLCGISGGGKSTVMGLIERFYDPEKGSIEFFGQNIKDLNVKWYRDQIGYVGQEPTLFEATIAENIAYGAPEATKEQIIEAAKQANAYDFIMKFPEDFDTPLSGGSGTQLSGGQKQRVAIARALVKKPEILLLDEATSALDNESERIVQEALDKLMESKDRTCIVIAHRLSTIRNADRIAFIGDGRVKEIGSHDELMDKSNGKYKRLVETQSRTASTVMQGVDQDKKKKVKKEEEDDKEELEETFEAQIEKVELSAFSLTRARQLAAQDSFHLFIGAIGAFLAGIVFPSWGFIFGVMIDLLFRPIFGCTPGVGVPCIFADKSECPSEGFVACDDYWNSEADYMRESSFTLAGYWILILVINGVGNILVFWGFGHASERMSKRVRDAAFDSLVRQDVSFFDKRNVGKITSELQEDATRIQVFTGDPIKQFILAMSGVLIGVVVAFIYMWPFAILAIACIPVMGFASSLEMKQMMGEDMKEDNAKEEVSSPGGIVVETLLNMGTVSALTLEEERYRIFQDALGKTEENYVKSGLEQGILSGLSVSLQQWIFGLQFWFGGWVLTNYPKQFSFADLNIAMFAILFGIFALGPAFQDMADRKETEESASRIFYLIDLKSDIDPLSEEGKTLDYNALSKERSKKKSMERKKSTKKLEKKKKRASSMKNVAKEQSDYLDVDDADVEKKKSSSMKKKKSKRMSKKNLDADNKPKSSKKKKSKKKPSADEEITPEESDVFFDEVLQHTSEEIIFNAEEDTTEEEIPADVAAQEEAPTDFNSIRAALEEKSAEVPPPKPDDTDDLF